MIDKGNLFYFMAHPEDATHDDIRKMAYLAHSASVEEGLVPTPASGQTWHSKAFESGDDSGCVQVLGTVQSSYHGLIVVEFLVRANSLSAVPVEEFLKRRTFVR